MYLYPLFNRTVDKAHIVTEILYNIYQKHSNVPVARDHFGNLYRSGTIAWNEHRSVGIWQKHTLVYDQFKYGPVSIHKRTLGYSRFSEHTNVLVDQAIKNMSPNLKLQDIDWQLDPSTRTGDNHKSSTSPPLVTVPNEYRSTDLMMVEDLIDWNASKLTLTQRKYNRNNGRPFVTGTTVLISSANNLLIGHLYTTINKKLAVAIPVGDGNTNIPILQTYANRTGTRDNVQSPIAAHQKLFDAYGGNLRTLTMDDLEHYYDISIVGLSPWHYYVNRDQLNADLKYKKNLFDSWYFAGFFPKTSQTKTFIYALGLNELGRLSNSIVKTSLKTLFKLKHENQTVDHPPYYLNLWSGRENDGILKTYKIPETSDINLLLPNYRGDDARAAHLPIYLKKWNTRVNHVGLISSDPKLSWYLEYSKWSKTASQYTALHSFIYIARTRSWAYRNTSIMLSQWYNVMYRYVKGNMSIYNALKSIEHDLPGTEGQIVPDAFAENPLTNNYIPVNALSDAELIFLRT